MKYKGYYWTFFAPFIKRSIRHRFGSEKKISALDMGFVMGDVLRSLRFYFAMTDLNKDPEKWYRDMKKYEAWESKQNGQYSTWKVSFDEGFRLHCVVRKAG